MKDRQRSLNIIAILLAALVVAVVIWGCVHGADPLHMQEFKANTENGSRKGGPR